MKTIRYSRDPSQPAVMSNPFTACSMTQTIVLHGTITAIETGLIFPDDVEFRAKSTQNSNLSVISTEKRDFNLIIIVGNASNTDIIVQQGAPIASVEVTVKPELEHVRFVETTQEGKRLTTCGSPAPIDTTIQT